MDMKRVKILSDGEFHEYKEFEFAVINCLKLDNKTRGLTMYRKVKKDTKFFSSGKVTTNNWHLKGKFWTCIDGDYMQAIEMALENPDQWIVVV